MLERSEGLPVVEEYIRGAFPGCTVEVIEDHARGVFVFRVDTPTGRVLHRLAISEEAIADRRDTADLRNGLERARAKARLEEAGSDEVLVTSADL